jgi:transcriptional regulator PpsR
MFASDNDPLKTTRTWFTSPAETIGDISADTAARLMGAMSDVVMVIDHDGVIRDVAISGSDLPREGFADIIERRWVDTVASDSRRKVEEILHDAIQLSQSGWREVNQQSPSGAIPVRFRAIDAGRDGRVIALGRDLRIDQALQQRILLAQQAMERDYVKLRQAESRYRVLFQVSSEAVLIVDPATRKIVDANPAAGRILGADYTTILGQSFAKLFHADSRDAALTLLTDTSGTARGEALSVRLADGRDGFKAAAALFRNDNALNALVSLTPAKVEGPVDGDEAKQKLLRVINRMPDAFVVTNEDLVILDANIAFLDLSQLIGPDAAKGQPLTRFLGRPGVDMRVLMQSLQDYGWVRNFSTVIRTAHGDQEEVELSAVCAKTGVESTLGFAIRPARRLSPKTNEQVDQLPRTAEELTQLVGRLSLRDIVAETTSVIERMCIKTALNLTGNNRASAAEILGLSRQSLYSKLGRHGLTNGEPDEDPGH